MRSGKNYVGTDWHTNQSQTFHFSASRVKGTRNVKVDWWLTTDCNDSAKSPTYYLCYGSQNLKIDGKSKLSWGSISYTDSGRTVYRGFTDHGSYLDNNYNKRLFFDENGDYTGIRRWVKILGTKWLTGSFTKEADSDGSIKFSVYGSFGWYGKSGLTFSKTFTVKDLVPGEYKIKYKANKENIKSLAPVIKGIPSEQVKKDADIKLSKSVPTARDKNGEDVYIFYRWATEVKNSTTIKSGAKQYDPGDTYKKDEDLTLYAVWAERALKHVRYDLNGGRWKNINRSDVFTARYGDKITTPVATDVIKDGYTLTGWKSLKTGKTYFGSTQYPSTYDNDVLTAQYEAKKYIITLCGLNGGFRRIHVTYGNPISGDFTYSADGYECVGWSPVYNKTGGERKDMYGNPIPSCYVLIDSDEVLPVIPNQPFDIAPKMLGTYIGCGVYGKDWYNYVSYHPYYDVGGEPRKYFINSSIILYPILKYKTSMYVYINGQWKLAMPYMYNDNGNSWKESYGDIYSGNKWKK